LRESHQPLFKERIELDQDFIHHSGWQSLNPKHIVQISRGTPCTLRVGAEIPSAPSLEGNTMKKHLIKRLAALATAAALTTTSHASTSGGLPWDSALTTLQNDLTGPVATAISVIAFLGAGAALAFGEELTGLVKKLLVIVLAISLIVMGNRFLSALGLVGSLVSWGKAMTTAMPTVPSVHKSCKVDCEAYLTNTVQLMLAAGFVPAEVIDVANRVVYMLVAKQYEGGALSW
jgi:type IV secretion system protein TrbC